MDVSRIAAHITATFLISGIPAISSYFKRRKAEKEQKRLAEQGDETANFQSRKEPK